MLAYLKSHGLSWPRLRLQFECICFSQPASQPSSKPSSRQQPQSVRQQQEAGRQVTHASTSISCGRAAGEICLFGYANHNADRLTQQITQFHCACHTYTYTHSYIHIYPYPGQLGICVVMRCAVKRSAAGRQSSTINLMTSTIKMKTETDAKQPPPYLSPHPPLNSAQSRAPNAAC